MTFYGNDVLQVLKIDGCNGITILDLSQANSITEVTVANCLELREFRADATTANYTVDASTCTSLGVVSTDQYVTVIQ